MYTISFISHKGGVGKSTCAFNVACSLPLVISGATSSPRPRVLFIDLDESCEGTRMFTADYEGTVPWCKEHGIRSLRNFLSCQPTKDALLSCVSVTPLNVGVIAGSAYDKEVAKILDRNPGELRSRLAVIASEFDVCVIDTPPARNMQQFAAIFSSNIVIPCSDVSRGGFHGVKDALTDIQEVQRRLKNSNIIVPFILVQSSPPVYGDKGETAMFTQENGSAWFTTLLESVTEVTPVFLRFDRGLVSLSRNKNYPLYNYPRRQLAREYAQITVWLVELVMNLPLEQPPYALFGGFYSENDAK